VREDGIDVFSSQLIYNSYPAIEKLKTGQKSSGLGQAGIFASAASNKY
jgi:hypothetical protein